MPGSTYLGMSGNMLWTVSTCMQYSHLAALIGVEVPTMSVVTFFGLKPSTRAGEGVFGASLPAMCIALCASECAPRRGEAVPTSGCPAHDEDHDGNGDNNVDDFAH